MSEINRITAWVGVAAVLVGCLGAAIEGCAAASPTPTIAQQSAQQVVTTAADAWALAASVCLASAGADDAGHAANPALAHECAAVLQPVHDTIVAAQVSVSVWDSASQGNFPCLMMGVSQGLSEAILVLKLPPAVADAALIAGRVGMTCSDGGK